MAAKKDDPSSVESSGVESKHNDSACGINCKENDENQANSDVSDVANKKNSQKLTHRRAENGPKTDFVMKKDVPEKIFICLDISETMKSKMFQLGDGSKVDALNLAKKAIKIFLHNKHAINKNHQFSLVVLQDCACMVTKLNSNPCAIIKELNDITETIPWQQFDLNSLFELIENNADPPKNNEEPPYLTRTVFIYGRSSVIPHFNEDKCLKKLISSKNFFMDVMYIHDDPSEENHCQEIYNTFLELDVDGTNYIMHVSQNTTKFHNCMAMLMGHPFQRCVQPEANYKLDVPKSEC